MSSRPLLRINPSVQTWVNKTPVNIVKGSQILKVQEANNVGHVIKDIIKGSACQFEI